MLALVLLVGLAACGSSQGAPALSGPDASAPASESASAPAGEREPAGLNREVLPPTPTPAPTPHVGVIAVVDVVQVQSADMGQRVFAMLLSGDVGTSAVFRSLEIQARMEPIDGSSCGVPPVPMVLRPSHTDAVQPALADLTRSVVVRSLGDAGPDDGRGVLARFGSGPVPSLNGGFDGWVSFHFPADVDEGFCAFDVSGVVIIVAGETTTSALPVIRVDTRDRLDGT